MKPVDLAKIVTKRRPLPRVLALLIYAALYESRHPAMTYQEIVERLNLPAQRNVAQFFGRILEEINEILPAGTLERLSEGRKNALRIRLRDGLGFTIDGREVTKARLESFGGFRRASGVVKSFDVAEAPWVTAVQKVVESEIGFRAGDMRTALTAVMHSLVVLRNQISPRMRSLLHLHAFRAQRRLENWSALRDSVRRARAVILGKDWTQEDKSFLQGIIILYEAWDLYDHAEEDSQSGYERVLSHLDSTSLDAAATVNASIAAERLNLLSLVKRRLTNALRDIHGPEAERLRVLYGREALSHNAQAIELAGLTADLTALSNYVANRNLILCSNLRGQVSSGAVCPTEQDWFNAIRWLALSHQIILSARLGRDNLWNACYLLITDRYSHDYVAWHHMLDEATRVCPGLSAYEGQSIVDLVLAMASGPLENALKDNGDSMRRQVLSLAHELVRAVDRHGEPIKANELLHRVVLAALAIKAQPSLASKRDERVRLDLRDWLVRRQNQVD